MRLIICLAGLLISATTFGQNNRPNVIPPSPEAASLGKYIETPVGLYTGVPEISVPIATLTQGELSVPIALSYHASGIKVEEIASWVGIGWSLSAGGAVIRAVHGNVDEYNKGNIARGFFGLIHDGISYELLNDDRDNTPARYGYLKDVANGCLDAEPDAFFLVLGDIQARFAFDWDGNVTVDSNKKIKVSIVWQTLNGIKTGIAGWDVVSDNGTLYKFRAVENTESITDSHQCYIDPVTNQTTAWYLSEIVDKNNINYIRFSYETYTLSYQILNALSITYKVGGGSECAGTIAGEQSSSYHKLNVGGVRLSRIVTKDGHSAEFIPGNERTDITGTGLHALEGIHIRYNNTLTKSFSLIHDYSTNRLTLRSVSEHGNSGSTTPLVHKFDYYSELPPRTAKSIDHWGYANYASGNQSLVPPATYGDKPYDGANREPDTNSKAGMLTMITYPTGGAVKLEYELHDYSFIGSYNIALDQEYVMVPVTTGASSIGPTGQGCAGPDGIVTDAQESDWFDVGGEVLEVSTDIRYFREPYFGMSRDPSAFILDESDNIVRHYTKDSPREDKLTLQPGRYRLKTVATWKACGPGPADVAEIALTRWVKGELKEPIKRKPAGGVRIKRITHHASPSGPVLLARHYNYEMEPGTSSGAIYNTPQYDYALKGIVSNSWSNSGFPHDKDCSYWIRTSSNPAVFGETMGSHIGYRKVTVTEGPGENGRSEFYYTSPYTHPQGKWFGPPFPLAEDFSFHTGLLTDKMIYSHDGRLLEWEHNAYESKHKTIASLKLQFKGGAYNNSSENFYRAYYGLILGHVQPLSSTYTSYDSEGNATASVTHFKYDTALQIVTEKTTDLGTHQIIDKYYYPQDVPSQPDIIRELVNRNVVGTPIETTQEKLEGGNTSLIAASFNHYGLNNSFLEVGKKSTLNSAEKISTVNLAVNNEAVADARYEPDVEVMEFDVSTGKPLGYLFRNQVIESYCWGYGGSLPIAKVVHAAPGQIFYTSFEDDAGTSNLSRTGTKGHAGTYQIKLPKPGTYTLTYWILMPGEPWELKAVTTSSDVTIGIAGAVIDEVRIHPVGAQMTTYTYLPGIGISSVTDTNNRTLYYEYDAFNRLASVRDDAGNIRYSYQYLLAGENQNHIVSNSIQTSGIRDAAAVEALTTGRNQQTIEYFDGLGRSVQTVMRRQSPLMHDIVQPKSYDAYGRDPIQYLPYTSSTGDGAYKPDAVISTDYSSSAQFKFYQQQDARVAPDNYPYSRIVYEASPLTRILKQGAPGEAWQPRIDPTDLSDHTIKRQYRFNGPEEVRMFDYDPATGAVNVSGHYGSSLLNASVTIDEHGNETIEYTDKEGRVILKKVQYDTAEGVKQYTETYYLYNDFGQLILVLSPETVNQFLKIKSK